MNTPEIQSILIDREAQDMNEGFPAVFYRESGQPPLKHTPPQPTTVHGIKTLAAVVHTMDTSPQSKCAIHNPQIQSSTF